MWRAGAVLALSMLGGCGDSPPATPRCVPSLDLACKPLYSDTSFGTLFDRIIKPTCASSAGQCHSVGGHEAGLVLEEIEPAYKLLLGMTDGRARVVPGDPACSLVVERLESGDPTFRMPPSSQPLSAAERCNFTLWIKDGAKR